LRGDFIAFDMSVFLPALYSKLGGGPCLTDVGTEGRAPIELALNRAGYRRLEHIDRDHIPPGTPDNDEQWRKWIFKSASDQRPVNLHVRVAGRANQRYPLLFRDYLRTPGAAAEAYAQVKAALSQYHTNDVEAYYDMKDPVCDIIMCGAGAWAAQVAWEPGASDC
jgi:GrpB-like predicted nucleotidyltransferase (UPF0157 family)